MTDSDFVPNDCLGLAQFLTQSLSADEAVFYLLSIDGLKLNDWKAAKLLLPHTSTLPNRTTLELTIKDIVVAFKSFDIETSYLVKNLALLPGFQPESLALTSYISSSMWAVKRVSNSVVQQREISERNNLLHVENFSGDVIAPHHTTREKSFPNLQPKSCAGSSPILQQKSWAGVASSGGLRQSAARKPVDTWTYGNAKVANDTQRPQLRTLCLAIRSGPDETVESLKAVFAKWTQLKEQKIEAVSCSEQYTLFRAQFVTPALLVEKWTLPSTWPTRISVKPWRGNPNTKLEPINDRAYSKKIYVGNMSDTMEMDALEANLKKIYETEIGDQGPISSIKAYLNHKAWEKQLEMQETYLNYRPRKSACVVITSKPGKPLTDIDYRLDMYPYHMHRSVRPWNGPIPMERGQSLNQDAPLNLNW